MKEFEPSDFTVLIVDDLPKNIQVLGNILKNQNYEIEFATSGQNALDWLEKKDFDLILLDIMMPEMDGFEVCNTIRKDKKFDDMPVLFLTAKTDKESTVKGFDIGAQDYITKPFDAKELLARVQTQLELKQSKQSLKDVNKLLEKKVEERTRELQKAYKELEALDVAKAEFLMIISHEIRTPMNGIKGFLDLLKSKIEDETLLNYFTYIDESSYRLEKFAYQALLLTELRTKKYEIVKKDIRLNNVIEQLITDNFNTSIQEKEINVSYEYDPNEIKVFADNDLFSKCITNIVENAVHYCSSNGKITIRAYNMDSSICIEIKDDGPGFSKKALDNLFKLFVPGETHVNENMGLDLGMVYLIMERHNGTINVNNEPEGGAKVKLIFPNN